MVNNKYKGLHLRHPKEALLLLLFVINDLTDYDFFFVEMKVGKEWVKRCEELSVGHREEKKEEAPLGLSRKL